jgi:hydroxycarboxylate dehydrogenase B
MPAISANELFAFSAALLTAGGARADEAAIVAQSLVGADLRGHDSHGVVRIPSYIEKLDCNEAVPGAPLEILKEAPAILTAEGHWGFGQVQARRLTEQLIDKTKSSGMAAGTLRHVTHVGRLGEYCELAASAGLISQIMVNSHGNQRWIAPPGGKEARLGTNPIAFGIPHRDAPLIFDFGTGATVEGKVRLARIAGRTCPDGWLLDAEGRPTTDPNVLYRNPPGTIRASADAEPFKWFGLGLMAEIFAGALSGGVCARLQPINPKGNCVFMQVIDPSAFYGGDEFTAEVDRLIDFLRACPLATGADEISLPGDRSRRTFDIRSEAGVPIEEGAWSELVRLAERLDVGVPSLDCGGGQRKRRAASTTTTAAMTSAIQ